MHNISSIYIVVFVCVHVCVCVCVYVCGFKEIQLLRRRTSNDKTVKSCNSKTFAEYKCLELSRTFIEHDGFHSSLQYPSHFRINMSVKSNWIILTQL